MKPYRPPLRYFGGKWRLADWIISFFPQHYHYIDVCGGAASILLQKPRSKMETYNDVDGNVVNFFRMLRDRPEDLIRAIDLTPWSREEYATHHEPSADPIESARRFWVGCTMSISCMPYTSSGMRVAKSSASSPGRACSLTYITVDHLVAVARRLKGVQIENLDYEEILRRYDDVDNLFYFDPPYTHSTRTNTSMYQQEWGDDKHVCAAGMLRGLSGMAIVSGYRCSLYERLYESHGWRRFDKPTVGNAGSRRVESLWLSPRVSSTTLLQTPLFKEDNQL